MASASNGEKARTEAANSPTPTLKTQFLGAAGLDLKESFTSFGGGKEEEQEQENDGERRDLKLEE